MKAETLALLATPGRNEELRCITAPDPAGKGEDTLVSVTTGERYPVRDGIPVFVDEDQITGPNRKYRDLYDRFSPFYDLAQRLFYLFRGGEAHARGLYLDELEINPGGRVLEVSIGTGANLRYLPRHARFYGLDLSWGQLVQCRRMLRRTGIKAELFLGQAERLPFKDETFDVVFHMGGINFFSDQRGAIREMIRVAKPGTKIVIVDETEKLAREAASVSPFFRNRSGSISAPAHLVPPEMLEVEAKDIRNGELYVLSFRKPGGPAPRAGAQEP